MTPHGTPLTRPATPLGLPCLLVSLAAGCSGSEPAPWVPLTRGFEPRALREVFDGWEGAEPAPSGTHAVDEPFGLGLRHAVAAADWRGGQDGTWWIDLPGGALRSSGVVPRLLLKEAPQPLRDEDEGELEPGQYRVEGGQLALRLGGETTRPSAALLSARLENGREVEGSWQVRLGTHCGWGIPVWSGAREEVTADVPPASQLSFRFLHGSAAAAAGAAAAAAAVDGPVRIRVEIDGETLLEHALASEERERPLERIVALPSAGRPGARLAFAVDGPAGMGVFFTPLVGPVEHGNPGARPWPDPRPDIVLFLIDTFRADNLALHGGDPALAPSLNRFAQDCLRFEHARSNAAWTLPSIASLLTGIYPGQHGATDEDLTLPAFNSTVTEALGRAGYRTGAITDDGFFAPVFGLDQGFEWLAENRPPDWDLDRTLEEAREFLERDDGRPLFLVVHTYRVHQPYRVGPDEDSSEYDALVVEGKITAGMESPPPDVGFDVLLQYRERFVELYRAGVRDLDRGFGDWLALLEERRFFEHGYLFVTSDHGEALGENDDFFHGGHLWEVKLRVPLLLRGPGIPARSVPWVASLLDLAPTFAELARIPADPGWMGTSLFALDRDRPVFAFQLGKKSHQVAFLESAHKVIMTPEPQRFRTGDCEEAFDLALDPLEDENVARSLPWPAEMTRRFAPALLVGLAPRGAPESAAVSPELEEQLDELGYGGTGDD